MFPAVRLTVKTRSQSSNEARPEEEFRSLDTVEEEPPIVEECWTAQSSPEYDCAQRPRTGSEAETSLEEKLLLDQVRLYRRLRQEKKATAPWQKQEDSPSFQGGSEETRRTSPVDGTHGDPAESRRISQPWASGRAVNSQRIKSLLPNVSNRSEQ
ncbi:hypothetical protein J6590_091118 [Homalodisca vitripennis]|nr:hypothetical protein J6590_091118 [Homalodisca vitripennis]